MSAIIRSLSTQPSPPSTLTTQRKIPFARKRIIIGFVRTNLGRHAAWRATGRLDYPYRLRVGTTESKTLSKLPELGLSTTNSLHLMQYRQPCQTGSLDVV